MVFVSDALAVIQLLVSVGRLLSHLYDASQLPREAAQELMAWGVAAYDGRALYVTNRKDCTALVHAQQHTPQRCRCQHPTHATHSHTAVLYHPRG